MSGTADTTAGAGGPGAREAIRRRITSLETELAGLRRKLFEGAAIPGGGNGRIEALVVRVGRGMLGLPVPAVREVVPIVLPNPLPGMQAPVAGFVNYRGAVVPVFDFRPELGGTGQLDPDLFLVVFECGGEPAMLVADGIFGVRSFGIDDLATSGAHTGAPGCLLGIARLDERVVGLVDPAGLPVPGAIDGIRSIADWVAAP